MLLKGWIKLSVSPHDSPALLVCKRTGTLQICIEFLALNTNMKFDVFPLPCITDLLDKLGKAKHFSSINPATALQ